MSDESLAITVAIPMRNAAATIGAQLEALAAQDYDGDWEVLVADNGSTDESRQIANGFADRLPRLRILDASARRGASHARNVALREARGDVFAMSDADDVVDTGWLRAIAEATRHADLVSGVVDEDALNPPVVRARRGQHGRSTALPGARSFLPYALGCNCAVRTSVARALDGWDESYVAGMDDIEFSWRVQLAGYSIAFAPDAIVYRRQRTTRRGLARQLYGYERVTPRLDRDFARFGVRPATWRRKLRQWPWIVTRVWFLASTPQRQGLWLRKAAMNAGWVVGRLRLRREAPSG